MAYDNFGDASSQNQTPTMPKGPQSQQNGHETGNCPTCNAMNQKQFSEGASKTAGETEGAASDVADVVAEAAL